MSSLLRCFPPAFSVPTTRRCTLRLCTTSRAADTRWSSTSLTSIAPTSAFRRCERVRCGVCRASTVRCVPCEHGAVHDAVVSLVHSACLPAPLAQGGFALFTSICHYGNVIFALCLISVLVVFLHGARSSYFFGVDNFSHPFCLLFPVSAATAFSLPSSV